MKDFNANDFSRLCAKFLGFKICPNTDDQCFVHDDHPWEVFHISEFEYYNDWDRIMELVELIEKRYAWVNIKGCAVDITNEISVSRPTKKEAVVEAMWQVLNRFDYSTL
jgi:hypothetical protein